MSYQRARKLTKRLCRVIQDCRSAISKARNARQREAQQEKRKAELRELDAAITELHGRHRDADVDLATLLNAPLLHGACAVEP